MSTLRLLVAMASLGMAASPHAGDSAEIAISTANHSKPAQVMVLGTYHFANPGKDVLNTQAGDILSEEKQREVSAVVNSLATFEPTKVMIEARDQSAVDAEYQAYVAGERELQANESEQLGFRLAGRLGHERVYAVDLAGEFDFGKVLAYAEENDPAFLEFFRSFRERFESHYQTLPLRHGVGGALREMNDPDNLGELNSLYPKIAEVGAGDTWAGANLVTDWHSRNIRIYANIARLTEPGDRVLVIFGSGHKATLDYMIGHAPDMLAVEVLDYLD